ncbi:uncharacterized protein TRIADDRAFT_53480 [Trichoplax adhaerens]|uniref:Uncharacterized protein n=1 Tax=Trichoplax adhaerens TaxID=10228 RepID=B3RPC0_TRIAD|nr:predicted protein [Trichoplax adhaerens]EDV28162.1 predicted protein [Trichoplax adhaerens]|eukprot:XP_002109996.1 predicted protein [Trichoplax adhaerens]
MGPTPLRKNLTRPLQILSKTGKKSSPTTVRSSMVLRKRSTKRKGVDSSESLPVETVSMANDLTTNTKQRIALNLLEYENSTNLLKEVNNSTSDSNSIHEFIGDSSKSSFSSFRCTNSTNLQQENDHTLENEREMLKDSFQDSPTTVFNNQEYEIPILTEQIEDTDDIQQECYIANEKMNYSHLNRDLCSETSPTSTQRITTTTKNFMPEESYSADRNAFQEAFRDESINLYGEYLHEIVQIQGYYVVN